MPALRDLLPLPEPILAILVSAASLVAFWYIGDLIASLHPAKALRVSLLILLATSAGMLIDYALPRRTPTDTLRAERYRVQQALEAHRDRQQLIDALPTLIWSTDPAGAVTFLNRRWLDYTGLTQEEAADGGWAAIIHPEDRDRLVSFWQSLLAAGVPGEIEARMRRTDGEYRWFLFRGEPIRDVSGEIVQWFGSNTDIDEIRIAERELRRAEERLRTTIDTIPARVVVAFPDGKVDFINASWIEDGFAEADLRAGPARLVHPEDLPGFLEKFERSIALGEPYESEVRLRKADGSYRWQFTRSVIAKDETGRVLRRYSTGIDIHERKEMEEALRARERELRTIIDTIPARVSVALPDGKVELFNGRWIDDGFAEADLRTAPDGLVHPDDLPTFLNKFRRSIATSEPYETEVRLRKADGTYRWHVTRTVVAKDEAGRALRRYSTAIDIHDRKEMEEALRGRERELRLIVDTVPVLIYIVDNKGVPIYLNKRVRDYYEVSIDDLPEIDGSKITGSVELRVHPDDREAVNNGLLRCFSTGEPFAMRYRNYRGDGILRWVDGRTAALRDDDGNVVRWYGVVIDIDEEIKAQDNLRDAQRKLSRAAQLASLAELSASIAHEVNQPLAAIVSNSQACRRWLSVEPLDADRIRCIIDRIVRDANAAASVVTGVRALYANETTSRSWIDVNGIVSEARQMLADDLLKNGVAFRAQLDPSLPQVFADPIQIQQVLVNLIRNGIEAMRTNLDEPKVLLVRSRPANGSIRIEVSDSGTGIQEPDRIFEPLFTTKARGMGMGLAVSRSILQAHGGTISAENGKPRGAVLSFTLPVPRSIS